MRRVLVENHASYAPKILSILFILANRFSLKAGAMVPCRVPFVYSHPQLSKKTGLDIPDISESYSPNKMKAITLVDAALMQFQRESGMAPRVILLPWRIFKQYEREANLLESVLPRAVAYKPDDENWTDVRVVEHEAIKQIEVY